MQSVSSRIWTRVAEFISYDDNQYTTGTSKRLRFYKESKDKTEEEFEGTFLHWVETDVLSFDRMAAETRHDPLLSRITLWIRKKKTGEVIPGRKDHTKKKRHKLTIEHGVICNGDLIICPETQRKLVLKNVHDDIHGGVAASHGPEKWCHGVVCI